MNTHILIPIKEIEERQKFLKEKYDEVVGTIFTHLSTLYKTELNILEGLLKGKAVSLDEKEIEEKAEATYQIGRNIFQSYPNDVTSYCLAVSQGYKQALKDLL